MSIHNENPVSFEATLRRKRDVLVVPPVALKDIGVESKSDKRLNIAHEDVLLSRIRDPQGDGHVYLAIVRHPFLGEHFAQLLNAVAPLPEGKKSGILDDLRLPDDTRRQEKELKREASEGSLHRRHANDSVIGELYREFDVQNRPGWVTALEKDSCDLFFTCFDSFQAFDSQNLSWLYTAIRDDAIKSTALIDMRLYFLPPERKEEVVKSILGTLTPDEQQRFAVEFCKNRANILVDLDHQEMQRPWSGGGIEFKFVDSNRIDIQNAPGYGDASIHTRLVDKYTNDWTIDSYNLPSQFFAESLYPLVAWRKDASGRRSFMNQQEVAPLLKYPMGMKKEQRERLDTKLGEVLVAYFSPETTETCKNRLNLQDNPERHQKMMGAQVPIWIAHPDNQPMLLSDENPVLPLLEGIAT